LRRVGLPTPAHLAPSLALYRFLSGRERLRAVRAARALARVDPADPAADRRTLGDWLTEHGQSPHAQAALWDLIARPTLNLAASEASLALGAFVFRTGLLESAAAGDIGWAAVPLAALHDEPARRALERSGVEVRLGWRASGIEAPAGAVTAVSGPERLAADAVVLAVPHDRAGRLAPQGAVDVAALEALGASPIVNLHVAYDRRVLDVPFAAGIGTPVQYLFDRTASSGLGRGQLVSVSLSDAVEEVRATPEELRARYLPALAELLPGARAARVTAFHVVREHAATFRAAPGSSRLRPSARTPVTGLALAGAWTATGWPATMEGAVRSGRVAAAQALAALGSERAVQELVA
jgi:squalene-associated FAD-dependent desaturase